MRSFHRRDKRQQRPRPLKRLRDRAGEGEGEQRPAQGAQVGLDVTSCVRPYAMKRR